MQTGLELDIPGVGVRNQFGKLGFISTDTLAAHHLSGFKEGVGGANLPRRTCEISKSEVQNVHFASDCKLRDESEHRDCIAELAILSKKHDNTGQNSGELMVIQCCHPLQDLKLHEYFCMILCMTFWRALPYLSL